MTQYTTQISQAQQTLDRLRGVIGDERANEAQLVLDTTKELNMALSTASRSLGAIGGLIEMGLSEWRRGIDRPDRLANAYEVADIARDIEQRAIQLGNAEAIFESDLSDEDVQELVNDIRGIQLGMDFGDPRIPGDQGPVTTRDEAFARATLGCRDPECFEHNGSR